MILGEVPDFAAVQIGLRAKVAIETAMGRNGRIDQQRLQSMALGKVRRIVAAERTADQQWPTQFGELCLELDDGLPRMVMQRRHPQSIRHADTLQRRTQLAGFLGKRGAVETVDIEDGGLIAGHSSSLADEDSEGYKA